MENENEPKFDLNFGHYRNESKKIHEETIKQHESFIAKHKHDKNPTDYVLSYMDEFKKDIKYREMRISCIEQYEKEKKVPKINVPDKYFSGYNCNRDKPSEEKLYPNEEISLYKNGKFVVEQIYTTCYFMAPILGLIDQGKGNYIKEKMIREYEKDPTKAIVRLHGEDSLPVDIIIDKTRFDYDHRPLWLIMLEKAVCVMMNTNKFGFKDSSRTNCVPGMNRSFNEEAKIAEGVNWYEIEEKQKKGEKVFLPRCFKMNDIGNSGEATGFKLLFGKKVVDKRSFFLKFPDLKSKSSNLDEKDDNMTFLKHFSSEEKLVIEKLVIGSAKGLDFAKIQKDHVMYFKSYDEHYVYGIESLYGNFKVPIAEFNKMSNIYAAEFPGDKEKSKKAEIEDHQENKQTNKIENNSSVVLNNKTSDSENKIDSPETTKIKTENITYSKNDNGSDNLAFTADKTNISITENQTNINIKSNEKNEIDKKDNTNKNQTEKVDNNVSNTADDPNTNVIEKKDNNFSSTTIGNKMINIASRNNSENITSENQKYIKKIGNNLSNISNNKNTVEINAVNIEKNKTNNCKSEKEKPELGEVGNYEKRNTDSKQKKQVENNNFVLVNNYTVNFVLVNNYTVNTDRNYNKSKIYNHLNVLNSVTKENTKGKQFINLKFIMFGMLFFVGSVLAFYCDVYLFISIISLIVGLLFIFLGTKSKLGNYLARKFFGFSPPKQNKIGNTVNKSYHRKKNNNSYPEQIINSGTSHERKKSD